MTEVREIDQRHIDLYDEFTHGTMSRRDFMERLAKLAGGATAAAALVPILQNNYAVAGIVPEDDDRLVTEMVTYDVDGTTMSGYLARLKGGGERPGIIVIHENRGLNPHIKDVARRTALEGFLAFAPDALAPVGGTPSDEDRAREMIYELDRDATVARFGRLDILINNAGITRDGLTTRLKENEPELMTDQQWSAVLDVNLKGTWLCCQVAALPMIRQKSGRIVNTASVAALGNIGQANYAASKAGVIGLTKTLALEWARYGIAVNAVAPGWIRSELLEKTVESDPDRKRRVLSRTPMGRFGEADDIGWAAVYLCSPAARFVTGVCLPVDGGISIGF